ncbi:hypothetical protein [Dyadobacter frigoris]|uniref:Uncharacterized protein n=1 Tax=Dyadobacter frigoris TaxID=2576211 RepID=A0A4U6D3Y9_9BACT|nr:hypothetical protein [Dyadobacter frigoris]TKT90648.1 hypothetical protein FDK13_20225 [Dyadobacter frigoris]GLU51199.1 hypothetical protein Dfri01_06600 [Dyadobacter frigoris]
MIRYLFLFFAILIGITSQAQNIVFEYDSAGNRVKRLSGPDLTPTINLPSANFASNGTTKNFTVGLYEVNSAATSANIQFSIIIPTGYTLGFDQTQTTITPSGAAASVLVKNAEWTVIGTALGGRKLTLQANTGIIIPALGNSIIGFTIQRSSAQPGSTAIMTVTIINDPTHQVYDTVDANNIYSRVINAL